MHKKCVFFRKSQVSIVRHVVAMVEAAVEAAVGAVVEAAVGAVVEAVVEAVGVTTIEVKRVVALPLDCATHVLKLRPHAVFNNTCPD